MNLAPYILNILGLLAILFTLIFLLVWGWAKCEKCGSWWTFRNQDCIDYPSRPDLVIERHFTACSKCHNKQDIKERTRTRNCWV